MDNRSAQDERLMTIVTAALNLEAEEREPYLRSVCGLDGQLYDEATEAIEWEGRMGGFLRRPIVSFRESDLPFVPGETVAERFDIIRKIGEGGMGVVYEAFDRKRNQTIAIKAAKPGFGRLLSPELDGCLKVRHRNVCLVNEIHSAKTAQGDVDFLTMELLAGEPLSDLLARKGNLPAQEAQEIARQLCAGLKEAHTSGVIHRDFKAANIILCRDQHAALRAVITDFGLSGEASRPGFFGTQRYMAPELLLGQKASKASDIYALGIVLYEMVAGIKQENASAAGGKGPARASHSYQRLVTEFLSIEPGRRDRAFETALQTLSSHAYSRRQLVRIGVSSILAMAGGGWIEREKIGNWLKPLPEKRFVALFAWPPSVDVKVRSIVSAAIDAIEDELARAESADRNFFVTSARDVTPDNHETGWLDKLGGSLGVNLALQASGIELPQGFGLLLKLIDVSTGSVLRKHQVVCPPNEIAELSVRAVQSASSLLNVHWNEKGVERVQESTNSAVAFQAFQTAENLRQRPNDDGLLAAIEGYKKALEADPRYGAAYARLAMAYLRLNAINPDSALLELARANAIKAIQLDQNRANGHLALAMVFNAKRNLDAALAEMRTASQLDPTNPKMLPWQAQIYRDFHQWDKAEQTYLRLQKERPNYWVSYNNLGVLLTREGRYREAIEAFHVAAAAAPGSILAFNNLGALYFKLGQPAQAEENYRRCLAIKPDALAYGNLAETLRVEGKFADAIDCCKGALKLAPSDDENWLGLADCYEAMGGHERDALAAFQKAAVQVQRFLDVNPNDGSALLRLALYRIKVHAAARESAVLLKKSEEGGFVDLDSDLLRIRVLELAGKRKEALELAASCLRRGPIRFQMDSVKDLRGLTKDPRYSRLIRSGV